MGGNSPIPPHRLFLIQLSVNSSEFKTYNLFRFTPCASMYIEDINMSETQGLFHKNKKLYFIREKIIFLSKRFFINFRPWPAREYGFSQFRIF